MKTYLEFFSILLRGAVWAPVTVFLAHVIASRVFHAYLIFPPLDIPMHFAGGLAIAFFFFRASHIAVRTGLLDRMPHRTVTLLVFSFTCTATVFWEFVEFISDRYFGTHAQLGLEDTLSDMLVGIMGGLTFVAGVIWKHRVAGIAALPAEEIVDRSPDGQ